MIFFELEPSDISNLNDADLREMVARLCEAELNSQNIQPSCVQWGGAQEAPDGGLDVRVINASPLSNPAFISRENTGFQVKKNSMSKAACAKEMLDKGKLKPVINDLLDEKGAYIIISGKDDCSDRMLSERIKGMASALEGIPHSCDLSLDFYGRDRLNAWLRQFPGVALWVRSRLGKPLSGWQPFGRWAATPPDQNDEFLLDEHPCVIDANSHDKTPIVISDGVQLVRQKLLCEGTVVRITGLSGVGKTRFAQALFEEEVCENSLPKTNVIYADLGDDLTPTASELVTYLIANSFSSYVVLDNCPPDVHRKLQKQVSSTHAKLSLLTIEYDISDDRPEETEVIHIEPSSEKIVSQLVLKRFPTLGNVNSEKIAEFSGGNARIAIALASRVHADETLSNFSDESLFKRLFHQRHEPSDGLLESAEILSLVYSFNINPQEFSNELGSLSRISELKRNHLKRDSAELFRRQLSQKRGNWQAVLPHALANRLARRALQNIEAEQINTELLKSENLRLFKSCAHRLGYLHDFEPARHLASTWIKAGGPLHNIEQCDSERLTALTHIAPVFPDVVLTALEKASDIEGFCTRENKNYSILVSLLRKIAFEDEYFERAARIILRFAKTEKANENYNSIVGQLASLFSLYRSGTRATPERRQSFVKKMLDSYDPKQLEIAQSIFNISLQKYHLGLQSNFDFGARSRDYGWEPKTVGEQQRWFIGFIDLLTPLIESEDAIRTKWAKELLANHFHGLWCYTGCFITLKNIIQKYAEGGEWPEMWLAIKKTIDLKGEEHSPRLLKIIEELERLAAPKDLFSEIEAYALTSIWDQIALKNGDYTKDSEEINQKIEKLGELAASELECLERLAPKLWVKKIDSLWKFGKGLAKGSPDQKTTFDTLTMLMKKQKLELVQTNLFSGFIAGVHADNPQLSQTLQESVLDIPELKPYFIDLLSATPITPWGTKQLIELAKNRELEAQCFQQITYGCVHEAISDNDLSELLNAIIELKNGVFITFDILGMRFFPDQATNYEPNENLRSVGRVAISKLLSMHRNEIKDIKSLGIEHAISGCLSEQATKKDIHDIIDLLCEGLETYRLSDFTVSNIINSLVKNHPEDILDRTFENSKNSEYLSHVLFKDKAIVNGSPLNLVPIKRVLNWCDGSQNKIQKIANAVSAYAPFEEEHNQLINPKKVILSQPITALLNVAEDKASIVDTIFSRTLPSSWPDSLADILEIRSTAFSELLEHTSLEVRVTAKEKLSLLNKEIKERREQEAKHNQQREQRFE